MDERTLTVLGMILLAVGMGVWIVHGGKQTTPPPKPRVEQAPPPAAVKPKQGAPNPQSIPNERGFCGDSLAKCQAKAKFVSEGCFESYAKNKVARSLAKPLENEHCANVQRDLAANCPEGCSIRESTMVIIPTAPEYKFVQLDNDYEYCRMEGSRYVTVRAGCYEGNDGP